MRLSKVHCGLTAVPHSYHCEQYRLPGPTGSGWPCISPGVSALHPKKSCPTHRYIFLFSRNISYPPPHTPCCSPEHEPMSCHSPHPPLHRHSTSTQPAGERMKQQRVSRLNPLILCFPFYIPLNTTDPDFCCLAAAAGAVHTRSGPSRSLPPALVGNPTRECRGLLLAPCCCIPLLSLTSLVPLLSLSNTSSIAGLPRYLTHTTVNSIGFPVPPDLDGPAFPQEHFISTTPYSMLLSRARAHELSLSAPPTSPAQHINAAGGRAYEAAANFCCLAAAAGAVHTRSGPSRSLPPALVGNPTRECRGLLLAPCCCIPLLSLTSLVPLSL
eukprot:gene8279-5798_t